MAKDTLFYYRIWERRWNTFMRMPLPWRFRPDTHKHWADRQIGDSHGPDQFMDLTPSSNRLLDEIRRVAPNKTEKICDLGCNCGRHLNALHISGYSQLYGVDIQSAAIDFMWERFPELTRSAKINKETFQAYLDRQHDQYFDVVFTHGATVELVSPVYPICRELARVTRSHVILAISETGHYYPRLWEREFARVGFRLTRLERRMSGEDDISILTFIRV